jgi:hypothetical protein
MRGGDACVALAGRGKRSQDRDEGDAQHKASPPRTSAPTGTRPLPVRYYLILFPSHMKKVGRYLFCAKLGLVV